MGTAVEPAALCIEAADENKGDSPSFQAQPLGVRRTACRHQHVTARQDLLGSVVLHDDAHRVSRSSRDLRDGCIQMKRHALVIQQGAKTLTDVFVFSRHQPLGDIDHGYLAAEATHRLGEFDPNVAPANHQQMLGNYVQLECLDVGERLRLSQSGDRSQRGPRTGTHDHVGPAELTATPVGQDDPRRTSTQRGLTPCRRRESPGRSLPAAS
jgi:hypothetical protein